jgi:thiosulfate oxidation carrier complex protein SoxZ
MDEAAGCGTTRRAALRLAVAGLGLAAVRPWPVTAGELGPAARALLAGRTAVPSPDLSLDLPSIFEQGASVPLAVAVASPMAATDYVRRIALFAEGNPFPEVMTLHLTPDNGRAHVATRIRLEGGEQEVTALAELCDGRALLARRTVVVGIGGCGSERTPVLIGADPPPEPRIRVPEAAHRGELIEIKTMIPHRMETGLRHDGEGRPIPRRIIHRMECALDGRPLFAADLTPAVAANAYLTFHLRAQAPATLAFTWLEDGGRTYAARRTLEVV